MERCNSSSPCLPAWCDVGRLVTSRSKHIFYKQKNQLLRHFCSNSVDSQYLIERQTLHFLTILSLWNHKLKNLWDFTRQSKQSGAQLWGGRKKRFNWRLVNKFTDVVTLQSFHGYLCLNEVFKAQDIVLQPKSATNTATYLWSAVCSIMFLNEPLSS